MAKTIHLVRHGHHAQLARFICGRMAGVELDELGRQQIASCAEAIHPVPSLIESSPQQRAQQSAAILARYLGAPVKTVAAVDELDFGEWTGRALDELADDPDWQCWNSRRGSSRPPNGESMGQLQRRVVRRLEQYRHTSGEETILIVSHAEPIRAALLHYANIALDDFLSISVEPASVNTLHFDRTGVRISRAKQRTLA